MSCQDPVCVEIQDVEMKTQHESNDNKIFEVNATGQITFENMFTDYTIGLEHCALDYIKEKNIILLTSTHDYIGSKNLNSKLIALDFNDNTIKAIHDQKHTFDVRSSFISCKDVFYVYGSVQDHKDPNITSTMYKVKNMEFKSWNSIYEAPNLVSSTNILESIPLKGTYEAIKDITGHTCHYQESKNRIIGFGGSIVNIPGIHSRAKKYHRYATNYVFYIDLEFMTITNIHPKGIKPEYTPSPRHFHSSVFFNDRYLFVHGGQLHEELFIFVFDTHYNIWLEPIEIPSLCNQMGNNVLCLVKDYLVLVGGLTCNSKFATYHLPTGVWKAYHFDEDEKSILKVVYHSCITIDDAIFVVGQFKKKQILMKIHCKEIIESNFTGEYIGKVSNIGERAKYSPTLVCQTQLSDKFRFTIYEDDDDEADILMGIFE